MKPAEEDKQVTRTKWALVKDTKVCGPADDDKLTMIDELSPDAHRHSSTRIGCSKFINSGLTALEDKFFSVEKH